MEVLKLKLSGYIPDNYTGIIEWENGSKNWYKEDKLHREDGPAIERINGDKYWYIKGKLHRTDGPAIVGINGYKEWFVNGDLVGYSVLNFLVFNSLYIGKEKGRYDLYWLKFLTEGGIKEYPLIPGMREDNNILRSIQELNSLVGEEVFLDVAATDL